MSQHDSHSSLLDIIKDEQKCVQELGISCSNNLIGVQQGLADVKKEQDKSKELKRRVEERRSRSSAKDLRLNAECSLLEDQVLQKKRCLETLLYVTEVENIQQNVQTESEERALYITERKVVFDSVYREDTVESSARMHKDFMHDLQNSWCWLSLSNHCVNIHMLNAGEYQQFFHNVMYVGEDMKGYMAFLNSKPMRVRVETREPDVMCHHLKAVMEKLLEFQTQVEKIVERSVDIYPVHLRRDPIEYPLKAKTLIRYSHQEITLQPEEECFILDNSEPDRWVIRSKLGAEGEVPSFIIEIPPPEKKAVDAARRLQDQMMVHWDTTAKKLQSQLIQFMNNSVHDTPSTEMNAFSANQKAALMKLMNEAIQILRPPPSSDDTDFKELSSNVTNFRKTLSQVKPGKQDSSNNSAVKWRSNEKVLTLYKDFLTFSRCYKDDVSTSRGQEKLLLREKDVAPTFVSKAYFQKTLPMIDVDVETHHMEMTVHKSEIFIHERQKNTMPVAPLRKKRPLKRVMSTVTTGDTVTEIPDTIQETSPFVISAVLDPRSRQKMSVLQAMSQGIIDQIRGTYTNPETMETMSIPEAIHRGLIQVEYRDNLVNGDINGDVFAPHQNFMDTQIFPVAGVIDPRTGEIISVKEAISSGILDPRKGRYRNIVTGEELDILEAIQNGSIIADPNLLEKKDENGAFTFVEFADVSYKVIGVVDPTTGQEISLRRAIMEGCIDKVNSLYRNPHTGETMSLEDAIKQGLVKCNKLGPGDNLDTDNILTLKQLHVKKQNFVPGEKDDVDGFDHIDGLRKSPNRAMYEKIRKQCDPNDRTVIDPSDNSVITLEEAFEKGIVDFAKAEFKVPPGTTLSLEEATTRNLLEPELLKEILQAYQEASLGELMDSGKFDPDTGLVTDPKSGHTLSLQSAITQKVLDPNLVYLYDMPSQKLMSLSAAIEKGCYDPATGKYSNPKTGQDMTLSKAEKAGLVKCHLDPEAMAETSRILERLQKLTDTSVPATSSPYDDGNLSLEEAIKAGVIDLRKSEFKDPRTAEVFPLMTAIKEQKILPQAAESLLDAVNELSLQQAIDDGKIDPTTGKFVPENSSRPISIKEAMDRGLLNLDNMFVVDKSNDNIVSLGSLIESGRFDPDTGLMTDPASGQTLTLADAMARGLIDAGVQKDRYIDSSVTLKELIDSNKVNPRSTNFVAPNNHKMSLRDALANGFLTMNSKVKVDPETGYVVLGSDEEVVTALVDIKESSDWLTSVEQTLAGRQKPSQHLEKIKQQKKAFEALKHDMVQHEKKVKSSIHEAEELIENNRAQMKEDGTQQFQKLRFNVADLKVRFDAAFGETRGRCTRLDKMANDLEEFYRSLQDLDQWLDQAIERSQDLQTSKDDPEIQYKEFKIMGRKRAAGVRQRAENRKLKMRQRRACLSGLGEPSLSEGKSPNVQRLSTPLESLSIPNRDVSLRSDSPPCVCTPPSVPPIPIGAGQTTATDPIMVCTPLRVPSPLCDAVASKPSTKVERTMNEPIHEFDYETKTIHHATTENRTTERTGDTRNKTANDTISMFQNDTKIRVRNEGKIQFKSKQNDQKMSKIQNLNKTKTEVHEKNNAMHNTVTDFEQRICERISEIEKINANRDSPDNQSRNNESEYYVADVIFVQENEPEIYPFRPLRKKSKQEMAKQLKSNFVDNKFDDIPDKAKLSMPKKVQSICGDGNCFFRALSFSILNTEEKHTLLRNQIVNHMLTNDFLYAPHLRSGEKSVSNYILKKGMLHNGTWATEVEILAAADLLKTDIYIFEQTQSSWLKFSAKQVHGGVDVNDRSIYLIHKFQAHYEVVLDVMEDPLSVETFAGNKQKAYFTVQCNDSQQQTDTLPAPVQGHFDQSNPRFLENAGKQCVLNSLSALIYSYEKQTISWTPYDVDQVLINGNEMYTFLQRSSTMQHDLIAINEIPRCLEYRGELYYFTFHESIMGTLGNSVQNLDEFQFFTLHEAVTMSLMQNNSNGAFVTFKGNTFTIIKQNNLYCVCDSHSRSSTGLLDPIGSSIVLHFTNIETIVQHCLNLAESMACQPNDVFEITAIEISKAVPLQNSNVYDKFSTSAQTRSNRLDSYFKDQKWRKNCWLSSKEENYSRSTISCSKSSRKEYMRLYMKTMRNSSKGNNLRATEKTRKQDYRKRNEESSKAIDLKSKTTARENCPEKHRAIDLKSKQLARTDSKYVEAEKVSKSYSRKKNPEKHWAIDLKSKTTAREKCPEKHRAVDLRSKQMARTDSKYVEAEKVSKSYSRKKDPEKHRAIDLKSKQMARTDSKFLEAEKVSKSYSRKKDPKKHRAIDLKSKQMARTDSKFLEAEKVNKSYSRKKDPEKYKSIDLKSKTTAREKCPKKHRAVDLRSKQMARTDSKYLEAEKVNKSYSRKKDPEKYKSIDLKSKSTARKKCPEKHRAIDLRSKQKKRRNPHFCEQEKDHKKKTRLNPVFLQAEAKADLIRKRQKRQEQNFLESERLKQAERRKMNTLENKESDKKRKAQDRMSETFADREFFQYKRKKFGSDIEECIRVFHKKMDRGPEYVCTCCQQTWFKESVRECCPVPEFPRYKEFYTGYKSVNGKEWICHTCLSSLKKCKVPKLSEVNGMKWPDKPPELQLHSLEERLIALRIPFMQIRELPRGQQYSVKGNVVNVPIDIQPIVNALPRQMDEHFTVAVKLKKRLAYKSCVFSENVRPTVVLAALHWLMTNSKLYQKSDLKIDNDWIQRTTESANEIIQEFTGRTNAKSYTDKENLSTNDVDQCKQPSSDKDCTDCTEEQETFIEVSENDCIQGNSDTLINEADLDTNKELVLAPGEGQRPISLYHDEHAEELSFPTIYCGQQRLNDKERQVHVPYSDIAKWELRSVDRRAATSVPNIFFKLNKIQRKQVADKVNLAIRRKKNEGKKITASEARNPEITDKIASLNEGYYIFRTLRNSPAYLSSRKKDVFAMIRQLGLPTWFMSLSSADTRWTELLKTLAVLSGKPYSDEKMENMTWSEKVKLVQRDPVTCSRYFDHRVQVFMNTVLKSEHAPIGMVKDTFLRIEFQNRGSPHVHMMIWTDSAPKYNVDSEEDIIRYVDTHVTCSLDVEDDLQQLIQMQIHKHSKTCKKAGRSVCRFGFPLPPLKSTMLLEPLDVDTDEYKQKYSEIHARMNEFKDGCDMSYEEFLEKVVQVDETEYIKCIRSTLKGPKIFLKRTPMEMRVNYYNATVLKAWRANLDLQFVLDPYACAMYIVSYISKSQRGMSTMLEQASKEAKEGNMDLKRQVRHIGNKFLNFVEISAQEASYLVLQMPLTRASREVVFINTSPPKQRVFLLKSQEQLENLPDSSTDIESDNLIKRYAKRPRKLERYCLADYVSELEVKYQHKSNESEVDCNDDDSKGDSSEDSDSDNDTEFRDANTIMTLRGGIKIRKRKNPRVIRYVRYSRNTNAENHYREKLLLFMPWRDEEKDLIKGYESYEKHFISKYEQLLPIIQKYEHHVEELDIARQQAEEDLASEFDTIAPNTEQVQAEDAEQSVHQSEEYIHYVPPEPSQKVADIGLDLSLPDTTMFVDTNPVLLPDHEYMTLLRSLNLKQREFFNHVVQWISTKRDPIYAFLSGGAGVGKSVVIKALYQALHRLLNSKDGDDPDSIKILLTAFTGKAAYNISGVTIASAFHKKMFQTQQHMHTDELNTFRTTYKDLSVVIIDEISMVGNKLLAFIHERLTQLTGTKRDFGGISIIAVGDLFQLSPVADSWIFNDLKIGLARNLWKENFQIFELNEVMRQKDDLPFAQMLNRLRLNQLSAEDKEMIKEHMISSMSANYPKHALHLFTENKRVDNFNQMLIEDLVSTKVNVQAHTDIIAPTNINKESKVQLIKEMNKRENRNQTGNLPSFLKLAVGMTYDVTVNVDVHDGLTNGASGVVKDIEFKQLTNERPAIVWILFTDTNIGSKRRKHYKHLYHKRINSLWTPMFETKRTFLHNRKTYERIQFPLAPSAAKTVHKAQGTTVDELVVDLSSSYKAPHIHYVALSRVRTLQNLYILDFNEKALKVDSSVHLEMDRLRNKPLNICYIPLYSIPDMHIKLLFNNARSLHKHVDEVRNDPNIQSADIIGICESRLMKIDTREKYEIPDFQLHRLDESYTGNTRPNHGLAVYIRNGIILNELHTHAYYGVESILIDAKVKGNEIQVIYLYKTPKLAQKQLMKTLIDAVQPCIKRNKPLFMFGDFNIDLMDTQNTFLNFMEKNFNCRQVITESTTTYRSLLDHVYTTETNVQTGVIPAFWSDHSMVFCAKHF